MRKIVVLVVLALLASVGTAHAWTSYLDGSALPGSPWTADPNNGAGSLVNDGGVTAIQANSWSGYYEWYTDAMIGNVLTVGSRFRLAADGGSGSESILQATANTTTSSPLSLGIKQTSATGGYPSPVFCLMNYDNGSVYQVLGAMDLNYHTAYIQSGANGAWAVMWDGVQYTGTSTAKVNYGGWAEFGSGTYQIKSRSTNFYFDWVGYGGASDMPAVPEPGSMAALGAGLVGFVGLIRRRK